jgi:hypothetical protein
MLVPQNRDTPTYASHLAHLYLNGQGDRSSARFKGKLIVSLRDAFKLRVNESLLGFAACDESAK